MRKPLRDPLNTNFIMVPIEFYDEWLKQIDPAACVILNVIIRKTLGFKKREDWISISQFMKIANLSKNTVIKSLRTLVDNEMIFRRSEGGRGEEKIYYKLNIEESRKTDNYCRICKITLDDNKGMIFHMHHIITVKEGGKNLPNNLILVCLKCHKDIHKGLYTKEQLYKLLEPVQELNEGLENEHVQILTEPSSKTEPTIYNNTIDKEKKDILPEYLNLALHLKELILRNNPEATIKDSQVKNWAIEAKLMVEKEKKTIERIKEVMEWSQNSPFWRTNVLSMGKLREKWNTLTIQMKSGPQSLLNRERGLKYVVRKKPSNV